MALKNNNTIDASEKYRALGAILIVCVAAAMAIAEMANNTLEEQMMIAHNKQVSYSDWYQSKSIKQVLKENELVYLQALLETDMIAPGKRASLTSKIETTKSLVLKYEAEKTELLVGSSNIPKEFWAQDLDGKMGEIIGLREWEQLTDEYEMSTKKFDMGMLFFQIGIVMGAICIILRNNIRLQQYFMLLTLVFGVVGILFSAHGYTLAP
tara:strand:+ start:17789 stop:18418 length:630 start_codon:yes stop_codon:yes gene_type:complete